MISRRVFLVLLCLAGCQRDGPPASASHVEIDALLVLMQKRLLLMHDVARWKWNEKKPIEDRAREKELLAKLQQQGTEAGLDADFTRSFFQGQIEAAKKLQQADLEHWQAEGKEKFDNPPDLANDLRPKINEVSGQLITALTRIQAMRADPAFDQLLEERARLLLTGVGVSKEVRNAALAPLLTPRP